MNAMKELMAQWMDAKEEERSAQNRRRKIEDALNSVIGIDDRHESSKTLRRDGFKVKVVTRFNRRVDSDKLQAIAAEHGLMSHLGSLFRWKPELNLKAWEAADASITKPLEEAITTSSGRPSYSIELEKQGE